jgi:hypothetical protein
LVDLTKNVLFISEGKEIYFFRVLDLPYKILLLNEPYSSPLVYQSVRVVKDAGDENKLIVVLVLNLFINSGIIIDYGLHKRRLQCLHF